MLSTFFITLVMMNLLIAIMSDTYDRVINDITATDGWELNQMILELESLLFWKKSLGKPQFMHWVTYTGDSSSELWEGRISAVNTILQSSTNNISSEILLVLKKLDQVVAQNDLLQKDMAMKFEEHRKKIDKIKVTAGAATNATIQ
jgi:hypothetical protein